MNAKTDQDVTTKSNEAFALLCLENQWDRWFDLYVQNDGKMTAQRGTKRRICESKVMPKYTRGGITFSHESNKEGDQQKGWTNEGILRFNELYELVSKDRKKNPGFVSDWLKMETEKFVGKRRRPKKDYTNIPVAKHELFSDCEDTQEPSPKKPREVDIKPEKEEKEHDLSESSDED